MNRRFIAPFLAVDATRNLAGGGYSPGSHARAGNDTGAGRTAGMGPAADALPAGGGGAVTSPETVNPGCPPNPYAQRLG